MPAAFLLNETALHGQPAEVYEKPLPCTVRWKSFYRWSRRPDKNACEL